MTIVRAFVAGERDPQKLAELRDPRCQKSKEQIAAHFAGNWRPSHLFNLAECLRMGDVLTAEIERYELEIRQMMKQPSPPAANETRVPDLANKAKMRAMNARGQQA